MSWPNPPLRLPKLFRIATVLNTSPLLAEGHCMRIFLQIGYGALLAATSFAQSTNPHPAFDAAYVQASAPTRFDYQRGPYVHQGPYDLYEARDASMVDLIAAAYGVDGAIVIGGPSWLEMDRFDLFAKAPAKSSKAALQEMLQALLAERFKLVVHKDKAPMPAWALKAGKHQGLKPSEGEGEARCKFVEPNAPAGTATFPFECRNITMARFGEMLRDDLGGDQYLNQHPVVDQTGLEGTWDFNFRYSFRNGPSQNASERITIFDALDKQLGLKLEAATLPLPVIMVDSADETPTENPPGAAELARAAQAYTEFEVADIKPTDPATKGIKFNIQPSGQVNISGATLHFMVQQLWQIFDDSMFVGAPKWWNDDRWDIVAKPPAGAVVAPPGEPKRTQVDFDTVVIMLKALMAERFKLAAHMDAKEMTAYSLAAVKPKMKQADPNTRSRFTEGTATFDAKDPRDSNPILGRLLTCQNVTMKEFGQKLQGLASGYIQSTVLDKTGLKGGYDFTLSFSTAGQLKDRVANAAAGSDPASAASDPTGAVSLFEAIERQMGLKLVSEKRPVPVLVIDHLEQKPTEN